MTLDWKFKHIGIYRCTRVLLLLAVGLPALSQAMGPGNFDYKADASARLYPAGALVTANAGYSWEIWRKPESLWEFGYVRPNLSLASIGLTNRVVAELEVFPVAILGFSVGRGYYYRISRSSSTFDCSLVTCDGLLGRTILGARGVIGASGFLSTLGFKYEWIDGPATGLPFADDGSTLVGAAGSDRLMTLNGALGYKITDDWVAGIYGSHARFASAGNWNLMMFGFGQYRFEPWGIVFGMGRYESTHNLAGFTAVFTLSWNGKKGPGLL